MALAKTGRREPREHCASLPRAALLGVAFAFVLRCLSHRVVLAGAGGVTMRAKLRLAAGAALLLGVTGCVGPTVVVMKNPNTGEIVQCRGANTGISTPVESMAARDCANGYQAAGWQRMN